MDAIMAWRVAGSWFWFPEPRENRKQYSLYNTHHNTHTPDIYTITYRCMDAIMAWRVAGSWFWFPEPSENRMLSFSVSHSRCVRKPNSS